MYNVYQQHTSTNIIMPPMADLDEVRVLAECAAKLGHDAFYRVFEQTGGPTGEQFVTSFSVLNGVVREHKDSTFPKEHWGN